MTLNGELAWSQAQCAGVGESDDDVLMCSPLSVVCGVPADLAAGRIEAGPEAGRLSALNISVSLSESVTLG
jgi:hypothetical protein